MKRRKGQIIAAEDVAVRRYQREARVQGFSKLYAGVLQVLAEGAAYRQTPPPATLLELVDFIAQPVVRSVADALDIADHGRAPSTRKLDLIIVGRAHVLIEAGIDDEVVWELVHAGVVPAEASSYVGGVHAAIGHRFRRRCT